MKDIQKKNDKELAQYVQEQREALRSHRFGSAGSGMRDANATERTRKEIARALTEVSKRKQEAKQTNEA